LLPKDIGYPVVVKPKNGNQGKGVSLNLKKVGKLSDAYNWQKLIHRKSWLKDKSEEAIIGCWW
jgi:glutathione synthase/RimK-type ligase-like ATP-grasp enzyme